MSYDITVLIRIRDASDVQYITAAVVEAAKKTLQAPGCLKFQIHQAANSHTILLVESWENIDAFKSYNSSEAFQQFSQNVLAGKTDREVFITHTIPVMVERNQSQPTFFRL